jgi:hypothetical protein
MCIFCSHFAPWMTISPSRSWIWQNRHCRCIRNAQNSREPVWLYSKWVSNGLNRSENRFCMSGSSLGLNREYSSARLAARLWRGLGGSARLDMACVDFSRRLPLGAWSTIAESSGGACRLPLAPMKLILAPMSSYGWTLHLGMIKMCFWQLWKFGYIPKTILFFDERGSDTNCW